MTLQDTVTTSAALVPHAVDDQQSSPRGSFALAGLVTATSTYLLVGALTMEIPKTASPPGPLFFPTIVIGLGYALGLALLVQGMRARRGGAVAAGRADAVTTQDEAPVRRWRSLLLAVGTLVAFVLLLDLVGWVIAGTLLFWGLATALGSRRPVFDLAVALIMSSIIQLVFSAGLGLYLPVGVMGAF